MTALLVATSVAARTGSCLARPPSTRDPACAGVDRAARVHAADSRRLVRDPRPSRLLIIGVGLGSIFAPAIGTATLGVEVRETGVASAMVSTARKWTFMPDWWLCIVSAIGGLTRRTTFEMLVLGSAATVRLHESAVDRRRPPPTTAWPRRSCPEGRGPRVHAQDGARSRNCLCAPPRGRGRPRPGHEHPTSATRRRLA